MKTKNHSICSQNILHIKKYILSLQLNHIIGCLKIKQVVIMKLFDNFKYLWRILLQHLKLITAYGKYNCYAL